ncbi:MAG: hypothetical protein GEU28_00480 [Dehalococcoidia bacterium]|nr:hypothetical protein [Dehalococcoidia bacterium]
MVAASGSVVTKERFDGAPTYPEYLDALDKGRPRYQDNYDAIDVSDDDARFFKELANRPGGPARVLVITEFWCPDCFREVPVMAKIAEAAGMDLRVLARDENLDAINEFLKDGQFQSIPVFVFYTKDHEYITHWIERTQLANHEMHLLREVSEGKSKEEAREDVLAFYKGETWARWRRATIAELKEKLAAATKS